MKVGIILCASSKRRRLASTFARYALSAEKPRSFSTVHLTRSMALLSNCSLSNARRAGAKCTAASIGPGFRIRGDAEPRGVASLE
jgi:hypothetical protein